MGIIRCQLYKIKSGLNKAILAKGSSCSVTSGVMHKGGRGVEGGGRLTSAPNLAFGQGYNIQKRSRILN